MTHKEALDSHLVELHALDERLHVTMEHMEALSTELALMEEPEDVDEETLEEEPVEEEKAPRKAPARRTAKK